MVRKKSKKKVLPLLVIISAIIFTGLIGAIFLFNNNLVSAVDYYTSGTPFVATWNTSKISSGSSNATTIWLPLQSTGEYNFTVYWGDGNVDTITAWDDVATNHTYATAGLYTISINGSIKGFRFDDKLDKLKLINISSWGDLRVGNSGDYFDGCENMNFIGNDNLNLTDMTSFLSMFRNCYSFNGNISNWDTSNITSMGIMFYQNYIFNQDISKWNTSKVTTMSTMFYKCYLFNQDISSWNVGKVTNMGSLFSGATVFNQNLSNWDTSSVTVMDSMFGSNTYFNGNISNWDVSKVTSMSSMFSSASSFNQDISKWNTSKVTNFNDTFSSASSFNQDISNWNTNSSIYMRRMFKNAVSFDQDLSSWNVSNVSNMSDMFEGVTLSIANYNSLLNGWASRDVKSDLLFDGGNSRYSNAGLVSRTSLISDDGWVITDGGNYNVNLFSNFSTSIGNINNYFYGVNTHDRWVTNTTKIDSDNNSVLDIYADYEWNRQELLNLGINYIRADAFIYYNANEDGTFDSSIESIKGVIKWGYENDVKVLVIISEMPPWLADVTKSCSSHNSTCPPSNYTRWEVFIDDLLTELTNNHQYDSAIEIEVWNEPWLNDFFMYDLGDADMTNMSYRVGNYSLLYNSTYNAVKNYNSSIEVIGGGGVKQVNAYRSYFLDQFMSVYANKTDGVSLHPYTDTLYTSDDILGNGLTVYLQNHTAYLSNNNRLVFSEWNVGNKTVKDTSSLESLFGINIAMSYFTVLNRLPSNSSMLLYQWSERYEYGSSSRESNLYEMVIQPELLSSFAQYRISYNVTKNFAHLLLAGKTDIKQSSSDSECLKIVSGNYQSLYAVIVTNTCNYSQNATLNMSMENGTVIFPYTSIMNYETGASIPVSSDGIVQLGVIGEYEVLYLTSGDEDGADLRGVFKLNEGSGNTIYDSLQNLSNGLKNGATWINDSILITLSAVQYTIDLVTGLLNLDTDYLYEYLFVDYDYNKVFGFHVSILGVIAGFLMIIVLGVGIIYVVKYFKNIKELE